MDENEAIKLLTERFHPDQVGEYVAKSELVYGKEYWSHIPDQDTLLRDMRYFVEAAGMERSHG